MKCLMLIIYLVLCLFGFYYVYCIYWDFKIINFQDLIILGYLVFIMPSCQFASEWQGGGYDIQLQW